MPVHRASTRFSGIVLQALVATLTLAALPALGQNSMCRVDSPNHTACDFPSVQSVMRWTVPKGVTEVGIVAIGAMGGSKPCQLGGPGAVAAGTFKVTPGEVISVLVGQTGQLSPTRPNNGAGGGGGSFAWRGSGPISLQNVMVAGGGGGGAGCKGTARAGSTGPEARNGVGGDRTSGVAGNNGQGGGGGAATGFRPTGSGGGGGGGIVSDGGSKNDNSGQDWSLSSGWGGKSIASGGEGGFAGVALKKFDNGPGEKGGAPLSQGGVGGFGGGGGGGGWFDDVVQARCTDRTAGGGGGGGGYSGGGGGSAGSSVAADFGSNCGNYGNGGGGGGSFVAKDATGPGMLEAKVADYKGTRDGRVLIGYFMPK
jgi:hypothetical protein